jgi:hypothetical protein
MKQKEKGNKRKPGPFESIGYIGDAGGFGLLEGGLIAADMLYSLLSSPFRDRKEGRGLLSHVFGESPIMSKINAYEEASKKHFGPMPTPARFARSITQNVGPTVAGERAVRLAKKYGPEALNLISKITPDFVLKGGSEAGKILNKVTPSFVKNMFKGNDINNKGVMVSSGIGAQAGEEVAEHFAEGLGPIGRFAGGLLGPYGITRFSNRFIHTPTAHIPLDLDLSKQEVLKSLSGNKRFSEPILDFAKRSETSEFNKIAAAEKAASRTYNEAKDILKSLNHQYNGAAKTNPLSSKRIDTNELVEDLSKNRSKYEVSPLELNSGEKPTLSDRTRWLDQIIDEAKVANPEKLNEIRKQIGKEKGNYGGGQDVYNIFDRFLVKNVPGYEKFRNQNDIGRQIEIIYDDFQRASVGKNGDYKKALEQFSNAVEKKVISGTLDIDRLTERKIPGVKQILDALDKKVTEIPKFNPTISQEEVLRNIGRREAAGGRDLAELVKHYGTSGLDKVLSFAMPGNEQRKFQSLVPGHFENPYTSALEGAALSAVNSGYFPALAQSTTPSQQNTQAQEPTPLEQNAPFDADSAFNELSNTYLGSTNSLQTDVPPAQQNEPANLMQAYQEEQPDPYDVLSMKYLGKTDSFEKDAAPDQQQQQNAPFDADAAFNELSEKYLGRR